MLEVPPHALRALVLALSWSALGGAARGQDPPKPAGVAWTVLEPTKLASTGGATFTAQADGSIVVSGKSAEKDEYRLEFACDLPTVTGFKLEALADPALPQSGPGRASNGNFALNEMKIEAASKQQRRFRPVMLQNASADYIESGRWPGQVCDRVEDVGANSWAVYGAIGKDHQLVVEAHSDVKFDAGGGLLQVELVFHWGEQHTLGRFRFSATGDARPFSVAGAGVDPWSAMQEKINLAIDRGVDWLVEHQQIDGSWNHEQWTYRCGATALSTYALLKSGVSPKHPAVVRALEFMRGTPSKETYTIGCQLLALGALDDPSVEPWIKELAQTLLTFQRGGLFNYPWGGPDLSNTQYGVLGLRAAAQHGFKVPPEVWEKTAQAVSSLGQDDGAGAYGPLSFRYSGGAKPTGSMTAAGSTILAICDDQLRGKAGKSGALNALAKRGGEWIGANWAGPKNPREAVDRWNIYYLYGVERLGSLLKTETFGAHKWYREGATALVAMQGAKGEWGTSYGDNVANTCFALLFLGKATAAASGVRATRVKAWGEEDPKKALCMKASGDTPLSLWIARIGDAPLAAGEWPKEDGRGLRVRRVEYLATGFPDDPAEKVVATVEKDEKQPCGRERFAAQCSFPRPGTYKVRARMTYLEPPSADHPEPRDASLVSEPLEIAIREALDPELLGYARDPSRNLLAGQKVTATASTTINNDWQAGYATDQLQCRGWACANDDPAPSLRLELEKPVRATTVLLTPAKIGDAYSSAITRVSVTLNGKGPPLEADVPVGGERRKIRLKLPQPQVVRRLDVKITGVQPCANPEKAVGFAEVELQAERPGEAPSGIAAPGSKGGP